MADLFEGAPPAWLQNFGENAFNALDNDVFDWIYRKSTSTQPPQALQQAGDMAYRAANTVMQPSNAVENTGQKRPDYMNLRARITVPGVVRNGS